MKNNHTQKQHGFTLVELLVVIAILLALAGFIGPGMIINRDKQEHATTVENAKQIYITFLNFDADFGSFPDDQKALRDPALAGFRGNRSNKLLGQLIASGLLRDEKIFYAKGGNPAGDNGPDGKIEPRSEILKQGECGFAYVIVSSRKGERRGLSTNDNGGIPVLMTPVADPQGTFNPEPYDGKGIIVKVNGSIESLPINKTDKKLTLPSGKGLLETGVGSVWGKGVKELTPTVLLPE